MFVFGARTIFFGFALIFLNISNRFFDADSIYVDALVLVLPGGARGWVPGKMRQLSKKLNSGYQYPARRNAPPPVEDKGHSRRIASSLTVQQHYGFM